MVLSPFRRMRPQYTCSASRLQYVLGLVYTDDMSRKLNFSTYGKRGAKALYRTLTDKQRREKARNAALARWKKTPKAERSETMRQVVGARWERLKENS